MAQELIRDFVVELAGLVALPDPVEFGSMQVEADQDGDLRPLFAGRDFIGTDLRAGPGVDRVEDLRALSFADGEVGTALCLDTLEHCEDPPQACRELTRVVDDGGVCVISSVMLFGIHGYPSDFFRFTPDGFRSLLAGFDDVRVIGVGHPEIPSQVIGVGAKGRALGLAELRRPDLGAARVRRAARTGAPRGAQLPARCPARSAGPRAAAARARARRPGLSATVALRRPFTRKRTARVLPPPGPHLPPRVEPDLDGPVGQFWRERVLQCAQDFYVGVPLWKLPEDLRVYEHLLWTMRADAVVELGGSAGGSALWFRDRRRTRAAYGRVREQVHVVSVDLRTTEARTWLDGADPAWADTITLLEGDVTDPALPARVREALPEGARALVVEDSAHVGETTRAALEGFADLVPPQGFLVVEDGVVDVEQLRALGSWPRGVLPAVEAWLRTPDGTAFGRRRDLELYGLTTNPSGILQRC